MLFRTMQFLCLWDHFLTRVIKNYRMGLLPMPRSGGINGNFIDKTFSIVANILLRIIPTTSGKKRHSPITEMVRFDFFFNFLYRSPS
ncbi:hypothetical protein IC575_031022 [Cucumis melo]